MVLSNQNPTARIKFTGLLNIIMCVDNIFFFFLFSAVSCGSPPSVMNAVFDPNANISYGSSVDYTCIPGYVFTRDDTSNRIQCDESGQWMPQISDCKRRYLSITVIIIT